MRCDCKTEWKGAYKHSPECAKKRVEWWYGYMIYEYECPTDKTVVSIERKMSDPEVVPVCSSCHGSLIRVWSAPSVVFNGPGFYSTDNPK